MRAPLSGASPCCCPAPPPSLSLCARGCPASTRFRPRLFVLGSFQLLFGSFGGSLRPSLARSRRDLVLPARRGRPWELSCPRLSSPARPQSDSVRLSPMPLAHPSPGSGRGMLQKLFGAARASLLLGVRSLSQSRGPAQSKRLSVPCGSSALWPCAGLRRRSDGEFSGRGLLVAAVLSLRLPGRQRLGLAAHEEGRRRIAHAGKDGVECRNREDTEAGG